VIRSSSPARKRCVSPLTISSGGTYTGGVQSTVLGTPAVTIATTAAVTLDRMLIRHKGFGVFAQATLNTNVTITNCVFQQLDPGSATETRAVYLLQPASAVIEHNRFLDGHGVLINGNDTNCNPMRIRFNDYIDIGRYNTNTLIGAVHFDQVLASSGAEISWNRIVNHRGRSATEDVIGIHESDGGGSGAKIDIHHNLIDGSYPFSGDGAGFTGGGIDLGDGNAGGTWQVSHDNTVVRVTNNGLMIPNGSNLEHHTNRTVTSGIADDGTRVSSTFGAGVMVWDNPGYAGVPTSATIHDCVGDHRRWNGSAWERSWQFTPDCDPSGGCTGNTNANLSLTTDSAWLAEINDAIADWEAARVAAAVTCGPVAP
jgi:hypothetical protein